MKLKNLLKENWEVKDGKVLSNGKLIGYYSFDKDSDSFWVDDVKKGKGQLSFDTKKEVEDYFKKNEKDAVKHLGKLRESVNEVSDAAYTIHRFTDCGQNAAQDFIDDNKIDGEKLVKFLKRTDNEGLRNRYMVRDIIGGKTDNNAKQKFVKLFKESIVKEGLDPKAQKFLDAIQVIDRDIKDLKNITVDATPQGNWSVYFKGKRMGTINGKMLDDSTIMKYGLEESADKQITEASEIQLTDLQPTQQKQIKAFEQLLGGKHIVIFDGIHGFVVNIKVSGVYGNYRFDADDLKKLIALKIRWVESDEDYISIGF